jgi:hypothetical protein
LDTEQCEDEGRAKDEESEKREFQRLSLPARAALKAPLLVAPSHVIGGIASTLSTMM